MQAGSFGEHGSYVVFYWIGAWHEGVLAHPGRGSDGYWQIFCALTHASKCACHRCHLFSLSRTVRTVSTFLPIFLKSSGKSGKHTQGTQNSAIFPCHHRWQMVANLPPPRPIIPSSVIPLHRSTQRARKFLPGSGKRWQGVATFLSTRDGRPVALG